MVATGKSPRLGLSTEFTRWKQRLDPKNAASTGMKPVESNGPSLRLVATNYRPTGIKPVVANRRKKCFTALPSTGRGEQDQKMWVKHRLAACATGISHAAARLTCLAVAALHRESSSGRQLQSSLRQCQHLVKSSTKALRCWNF